MKIAKRNSNGGFDVNDGVNPGSESEEMGGD